MKVKFACRRKHPCLKVMSNWVADKVMNQRKIWQNESEIGYAQFLWGNLGKKGLKRAGEGGQITETGYRWRQNKPENKKRPDRRLEQIDRVSLRVNRLRLIQSEVKRNQFESVSLERGLGHNQRIEPDQVQEALEGQASKMTITSGE